jgi:hypothetical protein
MNANERHAGETAKGGAKIALYNAVADYVRMESERILKQPPANPELVGWRYVVAIGEYGQSPDLELVFADDGGEGTTDVQLARGFDTYRDAFRWTAENCDIPAMSDSWAIPRGFERPRYPSICYLRIYTELTKC